MLWDCITYLDDETVEAIKGLGGLKAIAISHPHFFSTHIEFHISEEMVNVDGPRHLIALFISQLKMKIGECAKTMRYSIVGQEQSSRFSLVLQ